VRDVETAETRVSHRRGKGKGHSRVNGQAYVDEDKDDADKGVHHAMTRERGMSIEGKVCGGW
jgi:hypothetical protein